MEGSPFVMGAWCDDALLFQKVELLSNGILEGKWYRARLEKSWGTIWLYIKSGSIGVYLSQLLEEKVLVMLQQCV